MCVAYLVVKPLPQQ